jgi:hypothetical protein
MDETEQMPDELTPSQIRGALATLIYNESIMRSELTRMRARVIELDGRVGMNEVLLGATYLCVLLVAWQVGKVAKNASVS